MTDDIEWKIVEESQTITLHLLHLGQHPFHLFISFLPGVSIFLFPHQPSTKPAAASTMILLSPLHNSSLSFPLSLKPVAISPCPSRLAAPTTSSDPLAPSRHYHHLHLHASSSAYSSDEAAELAAVGSRREPVTFRRSLRPPQATISNATMTEKTTWTSSTQRY